MTTVRTLFLLTIFFCVVTVAQPKKGLFGITTTLSNGFLTDNGINTTTGALNLGMAYMPTDRFALHGALGFRSQKDTLGNTNSEFSFSANGWYYLHTAESVSTFLGAGLGFGSATQPSGTGISLVSVTGFFGAEYWFSPRFSWFGHLGIVYASYSIASKPATDVFTSATTGVAWYF
jgi:hypothetical protein